MNHFLVKFIVMENKNRQKIINHCISLQNNGISVDKFGRYDKQVMARLKECVKGHVLIDIDPKAAAAYKRFSVGKRFS